MTTSGMPWVKLHTDKLDDPRLAVLDHETQLHYYKLLMLAAELDAGGAIILNGKPLSDEEIAWRLRHAPEEVKASLKSLKRAGLVYLNGHGWEMHGFMDEQGPTQTEKRAAWRDRQNKHRTLAKDRTSVTHDTQPVTSDKPSVTPLEQSPDQSPESRAESRAESRVEQSRTTNHQPPSSLRRSKSGVVGGEKNSETKPNLEHLNKKQAKRAGMILPILTALGIRNPKLNLLLSNLATRTELLNDDLKPYLMATISSVYADPKAANKAIVSAYRIENKIDPPDAFLNSSSWTTNLPEKILNAAGIKAKAKAKRYTDGEFSEYINRGNDGKKAK